MTLVSPELAAAFAVVFVATYALRSPRAQNTLLVVAGVGFYGWGHAWIALPLLTTAFAAYLGAIAVEAWPARRWTWVGLVASFDLALWLGFSYGARSWAAPIGLSFYTLATLGYAVDVARGPLRARRDVVDFLAFAALFPPLAAGPIERAGRLFPQLERVRRFDGPRVRSGLTLAAWGALQKVVIADTLAPYVDAVGGLSEPAGAVAWASAVAFGVQLTADFAGYTNLARGGARMLGLELGPNFDHPFLAANTAEFWRRWHISLSSWLRDFVLLPLAGDRPGPVRLAAAVLVTFVAIGAWHGPGWHFVAFGVWHGAWTLVGLAAARAVPEALSRSRVARAAAAVVHLLVVLLPAGFLFRGPTLSVALQRLSTRPWQGSDDDLVVATALLSLAGVGALALLAEGPARELTSKDPDVRLVAQATLWGAVALALIVFHPVTARDFLYFRF